ncbi:hypothetical protein G3467_10450 [Shewanella baltica]|nr:hypothetical protein [Shewanella baltica]
MVFAIFSRFTVFFQSCDFRCSDLSHANLSDSNLR